MDGNAGPGGATIQNMTQVEDDYSPGDIKPNSRDFQQELTISGYCILHVPLMITPGTSYFI
jgi:hypothetical protein